MQVLEHALRHLAADEQADHYGAYMPALLDQIRVDDESEGPRAANVLAFPQGLFSLQEIKIVSSDDVDPRDLLFRLDPELGAHHDRSLCGQCRNHGAGEG